MWFEFPIPPDRHSEVFVSANYKLSFDTLRRALKGIRAWILVLDTRGINVWCAAGKGTFGTQELVERIQTVALKEVVSHKRIILPQLAAPGVASFQVKKDTGFKVIYGPVRAEDIPAFLEAGYLAEPPMRQVKFSLKDRLILIPVEMVTGFKYAFLVMLIFFLLSGLDNLGFSLDKMWGQGLIAVFNLFFAYLGGTFVTPILLPFLPGRAFSLKGALAGLILAGLALSYQYTALSWPEIAAWALIVPAISSFAAMNFTGSSTYTSLSGVIKEMRQAIPFQLAASLLGLGLWLFSRFVPGSESVIGG